MARSLISAADQSAKDARKWKGELSLAGKREKTWREKAEKVIDRYRGEEAKKNRFNILWSNTEILRPSIYNSRPSPDVRRRFRDADPLGKAVSELLERALMVMVDGDSTDQSLKNDVLDTLLCGRGISRLRYVPSLRQVGEASRTTSEQSEQSGGDDGESDDGYASGGEAEQEEVEYEQVCIEHVDWRDYREGYGRTWDEVPCTFYRHKLTKPDALKKFQEADIAAVKFAAPSADEERKPGEPASETQKTAEFWEVWDKVGAKVFFIQEDVQQLLYPTDNPDGTPPLNFTGFFPHPEPLQIIENTGDRKPIIPFHLYESQANELDKITGRIDRIVDRMRLRGVYDAKLGELADLMSNDDNELTPVQNAQAWGDKGLDAAISWFPIEKAQAILVSLYEARDRQKAIIDEITGIADIVRGATDPNETLGAQELKATFGSIRLQRMQKEVQRYAKDLMRLASEAMCEKFAPETFAEMTELKFPTALEKQQLQFQAQAMAGQPPQPGMPPPPPPPDPALLQVPSWDEILQLMRSSAMRRFKVDVETDSTVAGTLNSDMAGLSQVMKAISDTLTGLSPLVMSGALPVEAAKELVMTVIRRSRMGISVEDAFDKLKAPNPPPPPPDHAIQVAQIKAQSDEKIEGAKLQAAGQTAQIEQAAQAQSREAEIQAEVHKTQLQAQIELQKDGQEKQHEFSLKQAEQDMELRKLAMQLENDRLIADANNQTKLMIADLAAQQQLVQQSAQIAADGEAQDKAAAQATSAPTQSASEAPTAASYEQPESEFIPVMKELIAHLGKPKVVVRDASGKIVGVQ